MADEAALKFCRSELRGGKESRQGGFTFASDIRNRKDFYVLLESEQLSSTDKKSVSFIRLLSLDDEKKQRNVLENSKALPCGRMQPDIVTACLLVKQDRRFAVGHQRLMI